jgi:hypothetical protein
MDLPSNFKYDDFLTDDFNDEQLEDIKLIHFNIKPMPNTIITYVPKLKSNSSIIKVSSDSNPDDNDTIGQILIKVGELQEGHNVNNILLTTLNENINNLVLVHRGVAPEYIVEMPTGLFLILSAIYVKAVVNIKNIKALNYRNKELTDQYKAMSSIVTP